MSEILLNKTENKADMPQVIVSLTTYPGRIDRVHIAIESLIHQTRPADMIVLWLAEDQFPGGESSLPERLLALKEHGLAIEWCEDIKSYKKLIPSMRKWPDDIIITADDDIIYRVDTIETLLESYARHPDCVSTVRAHLMLFDDMGQPLPYNDWKPEYSFFIDTPHMALFPTTGAGTLFPPGIMPEEFFNEQAYMELCPKADDIWTKCMLTLAGVPVVLAAENTKLMCVDGTQTETLYAHNLTGNDAQLAAVLEVYDNVGGEEHPEETLLGRMNDLSSHAADDAHCQKYRKNKSFVNEQLGVSVSVIITTRNNEKTIKRCLASAAGQTVKDIEIICVDMASEDGTAKILENFAAGDSRVRVLRTDSACPAEARRLAVIDCRGEYCIFPSAEGVLAPDACEQLYTRAKEGDTDILAFTSGVLPVGAGQPRERFTGHPGRLRNTKILPRLMEYGLPWRDLHSCIFGARLCRKVYHQVMFNGAADSMYDFFMLVRNAEVYVGESTPVYYAEPEIKPDYTAACASMDAIKGYISFAADEEQLMPAVAQLRRDCVESSVASWCVRPERDKKDFMEYLAGVWNKDELTAAIWKACDRRGDIVLRWLAEQPAFAPAHNRVETVGVAVLDAQSADQLFTMTEVLDCVAPHRTAVLIGVSKNASSAVVSSAKAICVGEELSGEADSCEFARQLGEIIKEKAFDAIIVPAGSPRYIQTTLLCRMNGVAVIALLTEQLCRAMIDGSRPTDGISALSFADMIITDSLAQQELLSRLGFNVRCIPLPAIRMMGGRSGGRASANAIVWTGSRNELAEAEKIFSEVKKALPEARMLAYLDNEQDIDDRTAELPEGITLRRLRPDYGIFADAALHLMTRATGTTPASLRAAATMGVPTIMYALPGEMTERVGAIVVERYDRAGAAERIVELLADKSGRERLSAQAKAKAAEHTREEVAAQWSSALESVSMNTSRKVPAEDASLEAILTVYEDGAYNNAMVLERYQSRCERYEQMLAEAEERRIKETEALQEKLDNTKNQLREKNHENARLAGELNDLRGSTLYKVGSALTAIPRRVKKLISGGDKNSTDAGGDM